MKIGITTTEVLKNFASINPNIVVKQDEAIKTISQAKNILAEFTPSEAFPQEFGIYDLNEFLASVSLVEDAELEFGDKFVTVTNGKQRLKYFFSEPSILTTPQKSISFPTTNVTLTITDDVLTQVRKVSAVLGHTELAIVGSDSGTTLTVLDTNDATANTFDIPLEGVTSDLSEFNFIVGIPNLKVIPGDYKVSISDKLITCWENTTFPVKYYIALEKNSTSK
jgi:hypothetical protein